MKRKQTVRTRRRVRSVLGWALVLGVGLVELWMVADFATGFGTAVAGAARVEQIPPQGAAVGVFR
jgi:hypothetical protein